MTNIHTGGVMSVSKVAISLDKNLLQIIDRLVREKIFPSRSKIIQEAVRDKVEKINTNRLARECAKLDPLEEQALAEEGMEYEGEIWPEY